MKTYALLIAATIVLLSCKQTANKNNALLDAPQIPLDDKFNAIADSSYFDSLYDKTASEYESIELTDSAAQVVEDSINQMLEQLKIRVEKASKSGVKNDNLNQFNESLKKFRDAYQQVAVAQQDLVFYSYGNASEQGLTAQNHRLYVDKEYLFFLKAIFANSYYNLGFDTIKTK